MEPGGGPAEAGMGRPKMKPRCLLRPQSATARATDGEVRRPTIPPWAPVSADAPWRAAILWRHTVGYSEGRPHRKAAVPWPVSAQSR